MKLDISGASITPTATSILSKVSEFDIFKEYCGPFEEVDKTFCSELRNDKKPGVSIYINAQNSLRYKDFASGDHYDCFSYVMAKYNCTYHESLNIISNDFNLSSAKANISNAGIVFVSNKVAQKQQKPRPKAKIEIVSQNFNITDYEYWDQFGIPLSLLIEYNVFSAKYVYLTRGNKRVNFEYRKANPCYAYRFTNDGSYSYKIYWPLSKEAKFKWLFSGGASSNIEGYDQLPLSGETLILTKSLKDCMCYNVLGYPAISLQGESNKLENDLVVKLLKRFDKIIVNYDNDEAGYKGAKRLCDQYGFESIFIDGAKDVSDYIKANSIEEAREMIKLKLNEHK